MIVITNGNNFIEIVNVERELFKITRTKRLKTTKFVKY